MFSTYMFYAILSLVFSFFFVFRWMEGKASGLGEVKGRSGHIVAMEVTTTGTEDIIASMPGLR